MLIDLVSPRAPWRTERQAEERAAGIPAIGTAEWHRQYADAPAEVEMSMSDVDPDMTLDTPAAVGVLL